MVSRECLVEYFVERGAYDTTVRSRLSIDSIAMCTGGSVKARAAKRYKAPPILNSNRLNPGYRSPYTYGVAVSG
jgi:hypothetical protein